ncbi:MAG: imidazole glycerol phosphate synthase subunit HisH [Candidatus Korarchaeota archaeon]|nr:imidazole glycerol phosphate synthase subunit HisH [Candidatus Korarchaeota archaeon]
MRVRVFDYGVGNVFSVTKALRDLGAEIVEEDYDALILPGVGSFDGALERAGHLRDALAEGTPTLGICLGMQLLFERSEEGSLPGLGLVRGEVVRFPRGMKAPHMGWSLVRGWSRIFEGTGYFYFAHSYYAVPGEDVVRGIVRYGVDVPAIIEKGSLFGTQFHPEKSGRLGREVLSNFLREARR